MMKKIASTLAGTLIMLRAACSQQPANSDSQTAATMGQGQSATAASSAHVFKGEIMDGACAAMGGHGQMLTSGMVKNARQCTRECVKMGAKFVLYNPATHTTYKLDNQTEPAQFAGNEITVHGTLDASTNTIHVENIGTASS